MLKTVLITGSTRGIGRITALEFARNGYQVILNGSKKSKHAKSLVEKVKTISPNSSIYFFNVSDIKQVEKSFQLITKKYERIDVLINNAGILRDRTLLKMSYEEWDAVIKTNLYSLFTVTKQVLPLMIKNNWGRIINISSIVGVLGNFGQTNYSAAKAGIVGFTKSLAKETAKYNITVNAIAPGLVTTEILKEVPKLYMDKLLEKIPLKRLAEPEEIVYLLNFLSSKQSSYITGEVININGGWL